MLPLYSCSSEDYAGRIVATLPDLSPIYQYIALPDSLIFVAIGAFILPKRRS